MLRANFSGRGAISQSWGSDLNHMWKVDRHIKIWTSEFRYVASFWNNSALKATNLGQITKYLTSVKIRGGLGEMYEAKRRSFTGALGGCFRFLIYCSVSKSECVK